MATEIAVDAVRDDGLVGARASSEGADDQRRKHVMRVHGHLLAGAVEMLGLCQAPQAARRAQRAISEVGACNIRVGAHRVRLVGFL